MTASLKIVPMPGMTLRGLFQEVAQPEFPGAACRESSRDGAFGERGFASGTVRTGNAASTARALDLLAGAFFGGCVTLRAVETGHGHLRWRSGRNQSMSHCC